MQNWAHVTALFDGLNLLPTSQRDIDFSRVRPWYLEGDARRLRQTAILAAHQAAELNALLQRSCTNAVGRVVTQPTYDGCLAHAPSGLRQVFMRFESADPALEADARLKAFRERMLPALLTAMTTSVGNAQTLLFVPHYFDFVRVRELLVAEDVPFVAVSEYSTAPQVRARSGMPRAMISTSHLQHVPWRHGESGLGGREGGERHGVRGRWSDKLAGRLCTVETATPTTSALSLRRWLMVYAPTPGHRIRS